MYKPHTFKRNNNYDSDFIYEIGNTKKLIENDPKIAPNKLKTDYMLNPLMYVHEAKDAEDTAMRLLKSILSRPFAV